MTCVELREARKQLGLSQQKMADLKGGKDMKDEFRNEWYEKANAAGKTFQAAALSLPDDRDDIQREKTVSFAFEIGFDLGKLERTETGGMDMKKYQEIKNILRKKGIFLRRDGVTDTIPMYLVGSASSLMGAPKDRSGRRLSLSDLRKIYGV